MASAQLPAVITYHKPGTRPPLYVAGTFSDPPWQPCEMDHTIRDDGEYDFKKVVYGEPGSTIQYKFRIGDGDWWVLKDDGPTTTDSSGNTNHVLEVKPREEQKRPDTEVGQPLSDANVAAKHFQPVTKPAALDRSSTGTPTFARVAAEVADSAALLHEEVPEREKPEGVVPRKSSSLAPDSQDHAAEATGVDRGRDGGQSTTIILEPPPGDGRPFPVRPAGSAPADDQEGYIADKSPLFAHECVGLYESDEEAGPSGADEEEDVAIRAAPVSDIDIDNVDLDDPTLERFPSNRDEIIDAVRKLETGLQEDEASFDGNVRSSIVIPSRRGTEDITGDFPLLVPQDSPTQRASRKSLRASISSIPTTASLHSISEAEEPPAGEEASFRPAVVFTNPLKPKPKHLEFPTSDEDEGVAMVDGVSPRTVKPAHRPIATPDGSPPQSPPSPRTQRNVVSVSNVSSLLATAEVELDKDKERSMQEVTLHPAPAADSPRHRADEPLEIAESESRPGGGGHVRRRSYAEVAAAKPPSRDAEPRPTSTADPRETEAAPPATTRRRSYAEVAASKPAAPEGAGDDRKEEAPGPLLAGDSDAAGPSAATATAVEQETERPAQLRKRTEGARQEPAKRPESPAAVPGVQPKQGGGWFRAILRLIFVDVIGGVFKRLFDLVAGRRTPRHD